MAFERPTLTQLFERAKADMTGKLEAAGAWLRRSLLYVLSLLNGAAAHALYGYIDTQAKNLFTDTADEEHVRREAAQYGITPAGATLAAGNITVTGTVTSIVPINTVLERTDGVQFKTVAAVTLVSTSQAIAVIAVLAGEASNTSAGTPMKFISPVGGVSSTGVVAMGGLAGGENEEGFESLRSRIIDRKQNPPRGGSDADYRRWVREVFPSAKVWIYPLMMGPRTVGITFVLPNREDLIPTEDDITAVEAHLDILRPVTALPVVFAPTPDPLDITLWISPDNSGTRLAAEAALNDLIIRSAEPGGTTRRTHLDEAVSNSAGETDHGITLPAANVTAPAGHINVPGTITWIDAP